MYVQDARGMSAEMPSRAWYFGCALCKKYLDVGLKMQCPEYGENKERKVYGGQLMLADPSRKKELAVWEETLKRVTKDFLGHDDLGRNDIMASELEVVMAEAVSKTVVEPVLLVTSPKGGSMTAVTDRTTAVTDSMTAVTDSKTVVTDSKTAVTDSETAVTDSKTAVTDSKTAVTDST